MVEPNREEFGILYKKNRKAMHINACLSDSGKPKKVLFNNNIKNMHEGGMVSAGKLVWLLYSYFWSIEGFNLLGDWFTMPGL